MTIKQALKRFGSIESIKLDAGGYKVTLKEEYEHWVYGLYFHVKSIGLIIKYMKGVDKK